MPVKSLLNPYTDEWNKKKTQKNLTGWSGFLFIKLSKSEWL